MVIGRDGTVQEARVISGNPVFYNAALDAVKQWRYQPTLLNGVAIEMETRVMLDFKSDEVRINIER